MEVAIGYAEEARYLANITLVQLDVVRRKVITLLDSYCLLKKLAAADAIDLEDYLTKEQILIIEDLIRIFDLECEIPW